MWSALPFPIRLAVLGFVAMFTLIGGGAFVRDATRSSAVEPAPTESPVPSSTASARDKSATTSVATATGSSRPAIDTATPRSPSAPSTDQREARAAFHTELSQNRFQNATDAMVHMLDVDPSAAEDRDVRGDVVELAMRVMLLTTDAPDRVFDAIANKMGTTGGDILYELVTTRGGSRAAVRAEQVLRDEAVRARASAAMRIAYDLRNAKSCDDRRALFERAKNDGDGRSLGQLQLLNRRCRRDAVNCCLQNDPDLKAAMDAIKARLN